MAISGDEARAWFRERIEQAARGSVRSPYKTTRDTHEGEIHAFVETAAHFGLGSLDEWRSVAVAAKGAVEGDDDAGDRVH